MDSIQENTVSFKMFNTSISSTHYISFLCTSLNDIVYVDSSSECNDLTFQIGTEEVFNRGWQIKVTQYSCDSPVLAPQGCTQYFYGNDGIGMVQSYNFDGGCHLADQRHTFCVRQERGNCRICWSATNDEDVAVSGRDIPGVGRRGANNCCRYQTDGIDFIGFDCVHIPGAESIDGAAQRDRVCGRSKGLVNRASKAPTTLCSTKTPFQIQFTSDSYEVTGTDRRGRPFEASTVSPDVGIRLGYFQDSRNCYDGA